MNLEASSHESRSQRESHTDVSIYNELQLSQTHSALEGLSKVRSLMRGLHSQHKPINLELKAQLIIRAN